eukprot:6463336-Amphidinium_carterae.1
MALAVVLRLEILRSVISDESAVSVGTRSEHQTTPRDDVSILQRTATCQLSMQGVLRICVDVKLATARTFGGAHNCASACAH